MEQAAHILIPDPLDTSQLVPAFTLFQVPTMIDLKGLPMPPSSNNLYPTVMLRGRMIRGKSASLRAYERDMANWAIWQGASLRVLRQMILSQPDQLLKVDATYVFHRSSVLTLKGKSKKNDVSNRLKALHDMLAQLLGVDDCVFWSCSAEKRVMPHEKLPEYVDVRVSAFNPGA